MFCRMTLNERRACATSQASFVKSSVIRAMSAVSMAASLPAVPMAMPTVAIASAAKNAGGGRVKVMLTIAEDSTRAGARLAERAAMPAGGVLHGPALLVEDHTTLVVPAGMTVRCDAEGFLILQGAGDAA